MHPWNRRRGQFASKPRDGSYVPTIAERVLEEADLLGVPEASVIDDADPVWDHIDD